MPEVDPTAEMRADWRGWLALAWALGWGVVYLVMVVPGRIERLVEIVRGLHR